MSNLLTVLRAESMQFLCHKSSPLDQLPKVGLSKILETIPQINNNSAVEYHPYIPLLWGLVHNDIHCQFIICSILYLHFDNTSPLA